MTDPSHRDNDMTNPLCISWARLGYYFSQRIAYMILQYRTVHSWGICTVRYFFKRMPRTYVRVRYFTVHVRSYI